MNYYNNILETIGNTPLIKLNKVVDTNALVLAKVETFNPGNSIKDRMALKMVEDAEKDGRLEPGGTIIEGTSGNTGMGLALVAIQKGYKNHQNSASLERLSLGVTKLRDFMGPGQPEPTPDPIIVVCVTGAYPEYSCLNYCVWCLYFREC